MKLDNLVIGWYSRVFCTSRELDPESKWSPLVSCPVSHRSSLTSVWSCFSESFSRRDFYSATSSLSRLPPVWKSHHETESGFLVTGLSWRLRVLYSFSGRSSSLGLSWWCWSKSSQFLIAPSLFGPAPRQSLSCTVWFVTWLFDSADQRLDNTLRCSCPALSCLPLYAL